MHATGEQHEGCLRAERGSGGGVHASEEEAACVSATGGDRCGHHGEAGVARWRSFEWVAPTLLKRKGKEKQTRRGAAARLLKSSTRASDTYSTGIDLDKKALL